jgi:hypothetical protein
MNTVPKDSVGSGRMKMAKRAALLDLERLASEMSRISTDESDDYSRFAERIRTALEKITGKAVVRDRFHDRR